MIAEATLEPAEDATLWRGRDWAPTSTMLRRRACGPDVSQVRPTLTATPGKFAHHGVPRTDPEAARVRI